MIAPLAKDMLSSRVVVVRPEQHLNDAASELRKSRAQYCAVVDEETGAFGGLVNLVEIAGFTNAGSRIFADLAGDTPWRRVAEDTPATELLDELSINNEAVFVVLGAGERYTGVITMESAWGWLVRSQTMRQIWLEKVFEEQRCLADFLEQKIDRRTASLRAALDEFRSSSARLSHDIGGPLRTMKLFVEMLSNGECGELNDEGRSYVDRILRAATKVETLAADILGRAREAAKAAPAPLHAVDLNEVLADACELSSALVAERNAVIVKNSDLHTATGRYVPLLQIISNLLVNALTYVPAGRQPRLEIWSEEADGLVRLHFKDNGQGISPADMQTIFQPFSRVDPDQHPGAGLGLSIARDAVLELGGDITLESRQLEGSVFTVVLKSTAGLLTDGTRLSPSQKA
jgi:signal transduction histidine kinase